MRKIQQTKKGILTVLAGTALLIAAVCYGNNWFHGRADAQSGYRQITAQEAREIMETKTDAVILDVRTQEEYDTGHISGAVCLPVESIQGEPEILRDKEQTILVYCRSGNRSKQAAQKLADMGYTEILEFGGILNWPDPELTE